MALKSNKKTEKVAVDKTKKVKQKPNWVLRITILVIAIPTLMIAFVLLTSIEKKGEPVVGDRFENHLDPAIKDSSLKELKNTLVFDNVDAVEVNLISATLRIDIDASDALDAAGIEAIANAAYDKVNQILPIGTYFKNHDGVKMYDLEINVYNLIPQEGTQTAQIWCIKHKNVSEAEPGTDWPSNPKNEDVANQVKKQPNVVPAQ